MIHQYYCTSPSPDSLLRQPGTLAVIGYNSPCLAPASPGVIPVGLSALSDHQFEVLKFGDGPVSRGVTGRCHWSRSELVTCASIWLSPEQCQDIENASYSAYAELLRFLADGDHPHPFRIWNFIPRINEGDGDMEEYKRFCVGRLNAFTEMGIPSEQFPAASALGNQCQGAVIYALSSAKPGQQHENPNQFRAYQYPRQYGPSSPSFSRATTINLSTQKFLFISGTSSILGHETQAPDDFTTQLKVTLDNIQTLLELVQTRGEKILSLRVYLRDDAHLTDARTQLSAQFPALDINYTLANICRRNLLVEIEATVSCNS
jgi:chorismate lyase/3-hydroxybenzoate synthase